MRFVLWKSTCCILFPLLLFPLTTYSSDALKTLFVLLLMSIFWILEIFPLAITSLIPLVLLPLLQVMSTKDVASEYLGSTNFMFLGGLMMATAMEDSNLNKRISLSILGVFGFSSFKILFSLICVTSLLSMLISNTATTAMMIPILDALMFTMSSDVKVPFDEMSKSLQKRRNGYLLAIAYSANIGGTGLLTGSPPNLVVPQSLESKFGEKNELTYLTWALFSLPLMSLNLAFAGLWIYWFFDFKGSPPIESTSMTRNIQNIKDELGPLTVREKSIGFLFILLLLLWLTKRPGFVAGWNEFFPRHSISDASVSIFVVILLFSLPSSYSFWPFSPWNQKVVVSAPLVEWKTIEKNVPWGVILLLGGGYALAKANQISGLDKILIMSIQDFLLQQNVMTINFLSNIFTTFTTEIVSNVATAQILIPILTDFSKALCVNPIYLILSSTICSSYAFMFPISTAPNALIYSASTMNRTDMMKTGFVMNCICILTTSLFINFYGPLIFNFDASNKPMWLMEAFRDSNCTI